VITLPATASVLELFEQYHEGLLWVDVRSLQIVHGNAAARRLLGYDLSQLQALSITEVENSIEDVFFWSEVQGGDCQPFHGVRGYYRRADGSVFR
jgi:two-component system, NtrC family, sensor kinase